MKRLWGILMLASLSSIALIGCPSGSPTTSGPANTPTPTSTPPSFRAVTVTGSTFPAAITLQGIPVTAVWVNNSGGLHAVYVDDGGTGCNTNYQLPDSSSVTHIFSSVGAYDYHCQYHSPCGVGSCNGCTGMSGRVVVQ